jgi:glycine dehydrogenase subunit 1
MALLGPEGFAELGRLICARTALLADTLAAVPGVAVPERRGLFKEVVADVSGTGRDVASINAALLDRHDIFGGLAIDSTRAIFAVTECHAEADIARLGAALREVLA